ncbi:MFS transporter [Rhizobium tumorigenes]|uniref:MFS transporter n=1 Tax=Rhizobium tumorigenes TaxID=2041385 RepID=UPI00241E73EF|nr:MFS transporter [Rhizobium tumorigenes]WFS03625.1 MFS transporter [Rhizobium tumorigenes]
MISAYALAFGGFMLLGGRLGDLIGRRQAFIIALLLYGASSLSGGLATSPAVLVSSRAVQGLGGALLFPTTLALMSTYFTEGLERNKALAVIGAAGASGGASGALLGGLITDHLGWSWTFFVNVPVAGIAALAALLLMPRDIKNDTRAGLDIPGALVGTAGVTLLVLAAIEGPELGWTSLSLLSILLLSIALLGIFLRIQARTKAPLMPLRPLRHPTLSTAMLITGLFGAAFGAQYYLLTTYLQEIRHCSPAQAGMAFLPFALAIIVGTRIGSRLSSQINLRMAIVISLITGIAGQSLIALSLSADGNFLTHLLPGFIIDGLGQGAAWTLMWIAATSGIAAADRGIASGMASSAQQIGAALGLALLAGILANAIPTGGSPDTGLLIDGLRQSFLAAAGLGLASVFVALLRVGRPSKTPVTI